MRNDAYACFAAQRPARPLPGVERFDQENLCLPCGPWVGEAEATRIVRCILDAA